MPEVLIAAQSGRALAAAARASGYAPLVVDGFGDTDMRELAEASEVVAGGFAAETLLPALERLANGRAPMGLVCGTGFEDRPGLLAELGRRWPLLGNDAATVALVKHPVDLARLCAETGVPHPRTRLDAPEGGDWLVKRIGGAGGAHVSVFEGREPGEGDYFQEKLRGAPVSLLVLADGAAGRILGASEQWAADLPEDRLLPVLHGEKALPTQVAATFTYGGAVRPWSGAALAALHAAALALVALARLRGLASLDFLVEGEQFHLLEINPRPGATLDIYTHPDLFQAHIAACHGRLPQRHLNFADAQAAAIVYCDHGIAAMPALNWPAWACDRQTAGSPLAAGDPVCTVRGRAGDADAARALVAARVKTMQTMLGGTGAWTGTAA